MKKMERSRILRRWLGFFVMLSGIMILARPMVLGYRDGVRQTAVVVEFQKEIQSQSADVPSEQVSDKTPITDADPVWQECQAYNQMILRDQLARLMEPGAMESLPVTLEEEVFGTIWIPRMEVELGLYLGSNESNMAKGAAIVGQTSLPLGENNENVVISAHRGWRGTPMFRDIQSLQEGDRIYLTTRWAALTYEVKDLSIVTPEDAHLCLIQEDRSLLTLLTCHPYTKNEQRYLVTAELCDKQDPNELLDDTARQEKKELAAAPTVETRQVTIYESDGSTSQESIDATSIVPNGGEYGSIWSNFAILADRQMQILTVILVIALVLIAIWNIHDMKK